MGFEESSGNHVLLRWYSVPFQFFLHVGKAIFSVTAPQLGNLGVRPGARTSCHGAILSDYLNLVNRSVWPTAC